MFKVLYILLIAFCFNAIGMKHESEMAEEREHKKSKQETSYLSLLPQDLKNLLNPLVIHVLIKDLEYTEALHKIQELAQKQEYATLFEDIPFTESLLDELQKKYKVIKINDYHTRYDIKKQDDIAKDLKTAGAALWLQRRPTELLFLKAVGQADVKAVEDFLNKGINVNAKVNSNTNQTALMRAVVFGYKDIVELLLAHRTNVNAQDITGDTALMKAASNGYKDIVKMLLASGADGNAQDEYGNTALIVAASGGNKAIVEMLIVHGADVNAKDNKGNTALTPAKMSGFKDIIELLKKYT